MSNAPKHPVQVCLHCGEAVEKVNSMLYRCVECGEEYTPDELGIPINDPTPPPRNCD